MLLVPVLLFAIAACGGSDAPAAPTTTVASTTTTTTTSTTTTSAAPAKPTLDALTTDPCAALTHDDAVRLQVIIDGTKDPDGKSCQWGAKGGLIQFTAYPQDDLTKEHPAKGLVTKIEGHLAIMGQITDHGDTAYIAYVAIGHGSFQLVATAFGPNAPGPDTPTVVKNFAKAIVKRLS